MSSIYSYKHHIIPLHEWHRRIDPEATRYNKNFNTLDNVVWLTLEQHIQVHERMAEDGSEFDRIATWMLLGLIGKEEASRLATVYSNKSRGCSESQRRKASQYHKGKQYFLGRRNTPEQTLRQSQRQVGKTHTDIAKSHMSMSRLGKKRGKYKPENKPRKRWSAESCQKRSIMLTGKKRGPYKPRITVL